MLKYFLIGLVATLTLIGAALAGPYEDGLAAYERRDFDAAFKLLTPLAEQGHASAQNKLGELYANGAGVAEDDVEALKWYRLAAEQNHAPALNNLGFKYAKGEGVTQDDAEAVRWFRRAADLDDANAMYNLGLMYSKGRGVPKDDAEWVRWWKLAAIYGNEQAAWQMILSLPEDDVEAFKLLQPDAERGDAYAQMMLSVMYTNGWVGSAPDQVLAHMWLSLAWAQSGSDHLEQFLNEFAAEMTPDQIAEAQRLAREWKPEPER